jgi:cGMP-dependent protein kinase
MCGGVYCNTCTKWRSQLDHHTTEKKKRVCYNCYVAITKAKYTSTKDKLMATALPIATVQANMQAKREWTVHASEDGKTYFHNSRTGSTQWEPPATSWKPKKDSETGAVSYHNVLTNEITTEQPTNLPDTLGSIVDAWNDKAEGEAKDGDGEGEQAQPGRDSTRATINPFGRRRKVVYTQNYLNIKSGERVFHPKTQESKTAIINALANHYLFGKLSDNDKSNIADSMSCEPYDKGEKVLTQGEVGDKCYCIEKGQLEIIIKSETADSSTRSRKGSVSKKSVSGGPTALGPGRMFGELALLFDAPRAASVVCTTSVTLWAVTRSIFREMIAKTATTTLSARCNFLQSVPAFLTLDPVKIAKLGSALIEKEYTTGEDIIVQGAKGNKFFILESGDCEVLLSVDENESVQVGTLQVGDWFGEMALINDQPRVATVRAMNAVKVLSLTRELWHTLLGTALNGMMRSTKLRERQLSQTKERVSNLTGEANDPASIAAIIAAENAARDAGETKVGHRSQSMEDFDVQDLMSTAPEINSKFRVAWSTEFQGMTLNDLTELSVLGQGTYGRVTLVRDSTGGPTMALKQIQKAHIVRGGKVQNLILEKRVMQLMDHQFLLKLHRSFQDENSIFLLTEFVQGGEMWNLLYMLEGSKIKRANLPRTRCGGFYHEHARFYASCVIEALSFMHSKGVAYRDLKPENMMIDNTGYVKLIDMGFAKPIPFKRGKIVSQRSFSLCGTPDYVSPELVLGKGHDHTVDYWAYGVYVYELMVGRTPFFHDDQNQVFKMICNSCKYFIKCGIIFISVNFDINCALTQTQILCIFLFFCNPFFLSLCLCLHFLSW